jgi:hypothetical protein
VKMESLNHFGYSRPRIDSDTPSPKGLIRIQHKTESKDSTSSKPGDELTAIYNIPPNILRYQSTNLEQGGIKSEEYSGSVRLVSCKMNADPDQFLLFRKNLPISNQTNRVV